MNPTVTESSDGTRIITEYSTNESGQRIKITRRVRIVRRHHKTSHAAAERARWQKFGAAAKSGRPSFDDGITAIGEEVFLKLTVNKDLDVEEQELTVAEQVKKMQQSKITCRYCKGDHWTLKCPYKDTLQPIGEILDGKKPPADISETASTTSGATPAPSDATKAGKYVPPRLRGAQAGGGSSDDRRSEDVSTIRVTNLSEDTQEEDLHRMFRRFGPTSRIFMARDRATGLCKGFAFVSYYSRDDAVKAMNTMQGYGFDNLILNVEWAKPAKE